jgi:DNA-binding PadR family transcriptional regulator
MTAQSSSGASHCLPMHPLEFQVLLVLLEGDLHGYAIAKEIERRGTGFGTIQPTNLYRRLRDMVEKGILSEEPEAGEGHRRLFGVTPFGKKVAQAEAERLEDMVLSARRQKLLPNQAGEG